MKKLFYGKRSILITKEVQKFASIKFSFRRRHYYIYNLRSIYNNFKSSLRDNHWTDFRLVNGFEFITARAIFLPPWTTKSAKE